jgi:hypothetical protein
MKKYVKIMLVVLSMSLTMLPAQQANAQLLEVVKGAVKKAIKALDLKIQRLQNKTIWLQNAQKTLENALSKFKLDEIADWSEKQKEQYREYYEELVKIKSIISYYQRIKDITNKQIRLVDEYNGAWQLLKQDDHFTLAEIDYMGKVYNGILSESLNNIDQITLVVKSFTTQMSDAQRLELINNAADQVDITYSDLKRFNQQNMVLSLQRSKNKSEVDNVKKLYGLP